VKRIWKWLALFAYRRRAAIEPAGRKPVGVPGNRDPDDPCACYEPRRPRLGDFQDCLSDGHYLCRECCHLDPARREWIEGGKVG
jgi:hypothetical protein